MAEEPDVDTPDWSRQRAFAGSEPHTSIGMAVKAGLCIAGAVPVCIGIAMILLPLADLLSP